MKTHPCPKCGNETPSERYELLGVLTCINCTPQSPKAKGVVVYDHKTGGVLEVCNDDQFEKLKSHNDPSKDEDVDFRP